MFAACTMFASSQSTGQSGEMPLVMNLLQPSPRLWINLIPIRSVGAIVLAGTPPGFCAGSDLKELSSVDLNGMCLHEAETARLCRSFAFLQKPIIAAVDGFALGGGFVLAISCDIVVSSPGAKWGLPEVSIGWIPPWGLQQLVARVGPSQARRLTWGEENFDGREAHRLGIADFLANEGHSATDAALERAQKIVQLPMPAVAATNTSLHPSRQAKPSLWMRWPI